MIKSLLFIGLSSILISEASAEPDNANNPDTAQPDSALRFKTPFQFLFVADSVVFREPLLSAFPFPPTANHPALVWEEWGLKTNTAIRANVIDSTDSIRFFGRIHKASVWDARVR